MAAGAEDGRPPGPGRVRSRGGAQRIPRPPRYEVGGPPPWHQLPPQRRIPELGSLRGVLADHRPVPSPVEQRGAARPSAVLVPLYEEEGEPYVVLTRRSQHLRSHRGEVSFPGGGWEPADEDLLATALREAQEETALDPGAVEVIGELDHLSTVSSRSFIVPYVGVLPGRPVLTADPREVELILHVPLGELLLDEVYREERWGLPGLERPLYFFELVGDTVWGATAAILRNLLALATGTTEADPGPLRREG